MFWNVSITFTVSCISSVLFATNMSSWNSSGFSFVSPIFQLFPCLSIILVSESIVSVIIIAPRTEPCLTPSLPWRLRWRHRAPLERAWWELSFGTKQRSVCLIVKELRPFPPGEILNFVLHSDPHKKTQDRTTAQCWKHVFFAAYNPRFFRKFLTPLENFLTPPDALGLKGLKKN